MYLTAAQILATEDLPTEEVEVPEWRAWVRVRALTGAERDAFEASVVETGKAGAATVNTRNMRAKLCAMAMVDGDGKRLFTEAQVQALGAKNGRALDRIFAVAQRLSGITNAEVDALGEVSVAGPAGDLPSDSQPSSAAPSASS